MPKPIRFRHAGVQLAFQMDRVDRGRLYGVREQLVRDAEGRTCELATLAEDGKTLIGKGGTGIGQLTADGKWTDKSQLKPVDLEGNPIHPVLSSFAAPIELQQETSYDDYLNHNIRLVYELKIDSASEPEQKLLTTLREGAIFKFPYSYRGGLEPDVGFVLTNDDHGIFLLIGNPTLVEFIGLQKPSLPSEAAAATDEDLLDFTMM